MELHHNLIELTVERCSKSFTGVVEGMAKRRDVEKLAVAQYEEGECHPRAVVGQLVLIVQHNGNQKRQ